jgi:hypothetical protein
LNANLLKGLFNLIKFEGFDNRFDLFHLGLLGMALRISSHLWALRSIFERESNSCM